MSVPDRYEQKSVGQWLVIYLILAIVLSGAFYWYQRNREVGVGDHSEGKQMLVENNNEIQKLK